MTAGRMMRGGRRGRWLRWRVARRSGGILLLICGALAGLALIWYGMAWLWGWVAGPPSVVATTDDGRPALDVAKLETLSGEARQQALADYGRTLADRPRDGARSGAPSAGAGAASGEARPDQRRGPPSELRQLPEEDRRVVFSAMREQFHQQRVEEVRQFFALPPEQQVAELDRRLDEMEARRQQREAERAAREAQAGGQNEQRGDGVGRRGPPDSARRLERFRDRLDESTPEERAQMQAYFAALQARAKERGIVMSGPGGGRRP